MFNKILVPLDGSELAAKILPQVIDLAKTRRPCSVCINHFERVVIEAARATRSAKCDRRSTTGILERITGSAAAGSAGAKRAVLLKNQPTTKQAS